MSEAPARPFIPAPSDSGARRALAREGGFLYLPGLLPQERLAPLRALVDAALQRRGWVVDGRTDPRLRLGRWDDSRWIQFLGEVLPSAPYRALARAPEILDVLRELFEREPEPHVGDVCRLVSPGALDLTTPPHQDAAYLRGGEGVWTAWIPLTDCPIALGPLALWPGSHLGGLRPHAPVVASESVVGTDVPAGVPWESADLALGDVLFFSALTVHKALPNVTPDRLRVSVDYRYQGAGNLRQIATCLSGSGQGHRTAA